MLSAWINFLNVTIQMKAVKDNLRVRCSSNICVSDIFTQFWNKVSFIGDFLLMTLVKKSLGFNEKSILHGIQQ